jgi:hypothetical protein
MEHVIASVELVGQHPDGRRFPVRVAIGTPYRSGTDPETWACPVCIDPLYTHLRDIAGADSFQALCLASRTAIALLHGFVEAGGRLMHDDGADFPLDSYVPLGSQ